MSTEVHCPKCGAGFALTELMEAELETAARKKVEAQLDALRAKESAAATAQAELLKKTRALDDARQALDADVERRLAEETKRIRTQESNAAQERYAREADKRVQAAETALAETQAKLAQAAATEATALKRQRDLDEREQRLGADLEKRLAEETESIRKREAKIAEERSARDLNERLRAKDLELADTQKKLGEAVAAQAETLTKQRELEERERQLGVDIELRLAEETAKIRAREAKAAADHYGREAEERVRVVNTELEDVRTKLTAAAAQEATLLKQQRDVEERERRLQADIERRIAEETRKIREQEAKAAAEAAQRAASIEVRAKEEELADARRKLTDAADERAALLKAQRDLEDQARTTALDVERKVSEEAKKIRERAAKDAAEQSSLEAERQRLRDEEHRQQMEGMKRHIAELQRRAQQGSVQLQGEAQEVVLRDLLLEAFEDDDISDIGKGINGADAIQCVRGLGGSDCGSIVWESKRTKAWSSDWLSKARDDQRAAGAACAVIVTQALPPGIRHFAVVDGVWVCGWSYATALGAALRASLVEVALARRSAEGRGEKMQMLYEYLTGTEFRNRVGGFVEAFKEMQEELESEKRAMLTRWKRRERLMQRARDNITAFYGDLQGIAGRQLQDLPALALEAGPTDDVADTEHAADTDLCELLLALVPDDGSNSGNGSLLALFTERALTEHGVIVTANDYERCKGILLADGRLRRGKGKGGSVCRA